MWQTVLCAHLVASFFSHPPASAQTSHEKSVNPGSGTLPDVITGLPRRANSGTLESVTLIGSERMRSIDVIEELALMYGERLTDERVADIREKLLSFGLFKSVIVYQRKGSKPGLIKLVIEVENDDSVVGNWGIGGLIGLTHNERQFSIANPNSSPFAYKLQLLGRNLFLSQHRALAMVDVDGHGVWRQLRFAYGLPRFAKEDTQFDLEFAATDVHDRYLDTLGFGIKSQGLWTHSLGPVEVQFGPAIYLNRKSRFAMPGFPETAAGPKFNIIKATRLNRFFPSQGYSLSFGGLYNINTSYHSIAEINGGYTFDLWSYVFASFDAKFMSIGRNGYSFRGENRYDIPIGNLGNANQLAGLFFAVKAASDEFEDTHLQGQAAVLGLRYYSSALIAEFALEITRSPSEFAKDPIENKRFFTDRERDRP